MVGSLIVFAELVIVISRYLFSYEQSFMADLVDIGMRTILFMSAYLFMMRGTLEGRIICGS